VGLREIFILFIIIAIFAGVCFATVALEERYVQSVAFRWKVIARIT